MKDPVKDLMLQALKATQRMRNCPIVDDDFPSLRDHADYLIRHAIADAEAEIAKNGPTQEKPE